MASKKNYYYVLVFTEAGPVYVTSVSWKDKTSYWNNKEKPMLMTKSMAQDLMFGLSCNGYHAVLVQTFYELGNQPYRYEEYEFKFEKIEK